MISTTMLCSGTNLAKLCQRRFLSSASCSNSKCDVLISGGGLVGCATAISLAQNPFLSNKKFLLLEGAPVKTYQHPKDYSNRVIAINNTTKGLFEDLGIWGEIQSFRFKEVKGMHVWDSLGQRNMISFKAPQGKSHFYIVENDLVVHSLESRLKELHNVKVKNESSILSFESEEEEKIKVQLKDGSEVETRILVGADGANSTVRKGMKNNPYLSKNYNQFGVVGTLHFRDEITNDYAWQKFLPTGPIAMLPLSETKSSLVWTLPSEKAQQMIRSDPEEFVIELKKGLGVKPETDSESTFPDIEKVTNVAGFPLGLGHASRYVQQPGIVLVGDAGHRVHPLAGQGVNLGFGDVISLTQNLASCVESGSKFGTYSYLLQYETERQRHNVPMMLGIDLLQQIYGSQNGIIKTARGFGISLINSSTTLKNVITSFAA